MSNQHDHDHLKTYVAVWLALLACTWLTVFVAEIDLGEWNIVLAMTIAVFKATIVGLFFMHLKGSSGLTKLIAVAGLFWMGILFVMTFTDYISRHWSAPNHFV